MTDCAMVSLATMTALMPGCWPSIVVNTVCAVAASQLPLWSASFYQPGCFDSTEL
jgi:hypothetical protein